MSIHPDWDAEKATAHLDNLRADYDRLQAIADAFQEAADDAQRTADQRTAQIKHCERMFAEPKPDRAAAGGAS